MGTLHWQNSMCCVIAMRHNSAFEALVVGLDLENPSLAPFNSFQLRTDNLRGTN